MGNGYLMEERPNKNLSGFRECWNSNRELNNSHENTDKICDDIVNLLPSDPFDMDMMDISAKFNTITGWIEKEFEFRALGFGPDQTEVKLYPEVGDMETDAKSVGSSIGCTKDYCYGDGGAPPDALFFALGYLGVRDLLSVEKVCKSLRDAVQNDPLLWRSIHVDQPLSNRITDDALLQLTSRAQGSLQCLSLVECLKITDVGLKGVLESNSGMTKLCVPGCVRLSVESILCNLRVLKSAGTNGIKQLRIGGLLGVTKKHYEELEVLLGADHNKQLSTHKLRFYHDSHLYLSFDDDRAIDIETCPSCQQLRQVYDCPAETCEGKPCRACTFCIARCINCGCCINGRDYEETFCLDLLCLDCLKQLLNCEERHEEIGVPSKHTIFHQEARYHICFYG